MHLQWKWLRNVYELPALEGRQGIDKLVMAWRQG